MSTASGRQEVFIRNGLFTIGVFSAIDVKPHQFFINAGCLLDERKVLYGIGGYLYEKAVVYGFSCTPFLQMPIQTVHRLLTGIYRFLPVEAND